MPNVRHNRRFTIYDMMDARGDFESNPANSYSRDEQGLPLYKGPVPFPKMLYHPKGEEKVTRPAEAISTPFGPKWVGEQRAIITKIVTTEEELEEAKSAGWHETPREARRARAKAKGEEFVETATPSELALDAKNDEMRLLREENEKLAIRLAELENGLKPSGASAAGGKSK